MKKIYYVTKTIATIPCIGLVPIGVCLMCSALSRLEFGFVALIMGCIIAYIWAIFNFASPVINPAFIKSAESHQKFLWVNVVITAVFSALLLFIGICLWPLLIKIFTWLSDEIFDVKLSGSAEFLWMYFWANELFHISYLLLWEYVREHRWIRRFTIPNVCW
ncbi:MAG: hypothetical protein IJ677_06740 [Alphaproteobacteria bacterium]|nr:hypothetical protein [Alphaproteobacteria bacterium]